MRSLERTIVRVGGKQRDGVRPKQPNSWSRANCKSISTTFILMKRDSLQVHKLWAAAGGGGKQRKAETVILLNTLY